MKKRPMRKKKTVQIIVNRMVIQLKEKQKVKILIKQKTEKKTTTTMTKTTKLKAKINVRTNLMLTILTKIPNKQNLTLFNSFYLLILKF